ncbi:hypothetical protein J5N97_028840 [Dioscorea zingiberensis]|uniref:Uncharacterized protein n=1 Tax=Dioscorea zingiberensis TaxID=325984 RepID=A0A9D5BZS6_9LILI|nr:hypothetical protein J5N97_028840 [Dioscorea zingiberensis]
MRLSKKQGIREKDMRLLSFADKLLTILLASNTSHLPGLEEYKHHGGVNFYHAGDTVRLNCAKEVPCSAMKSSFLEGYAQLDLQSSIYFLSPKDNVSSHSSSYINFVIITFPLLIFTAVRHQSFGFVEGPWKRELKSKRPG